MRQAQRTNLGRRGGAVIWTSVDWVSPPESRSWFSTYTIELRLSRGQVTFRVISKSQYDSEVASGPHPEWSSHAPVSSYVHSEGIFRFRGMKRPSAFFDWAKWV